MLLARNLLSSLLLATALLFATTVHAQSQDDFLVDGRYIPGISDVIGDVGSSWAGTFSVQPNNQGNRKIWFWAWPPSQGAPDDVVTFYFPGGPGCAGAWSALQGIGPVLYPFGSTGPVQRNPFSWTQTGWVVFVDSPIGAGFSEGDPQCADMYCVANEFLHFLDNFLGVFGNLRGKKLNLVGQSYGGPAANHIAREIFARGNPYNLQTVGVISGRWLEDLVQSKVVAYDFAVTHRGTLRLTDDDVGRITALADRQGVGQGYLEGVLTYPPRGPYVPPAYDYGQDVWGLVRDRAAAHNQCLNIYDVSSRCGAATQQHLADFINGTPGLKAYLHAGDPARAWEVCASRKVLTGDRRPNGDNTDYPMEDDTFDTVLAQTSSYLVATAEDDFRFLAKGTLLGVQSKTWRGQQGFQGAPNAPLVASGNNVGQWGKERGLVYAHVTGAGHDISYRQPEIALKLNQFLLGQIDPSQLSS